MTAMNKTEHLLTCLIEECAEIQHAAAKALRFGPQDGYPGADTTNAQDIAREVTELIAVIDLCREHGVFGQPGEAKAIYDSKRKRVAEFMEYAKTTGALNTHNAQQAKEGEVGK
jgi:hypothetical protein